MQVIHVQETLSRAIYHVLDDLLRYTVTLDKSFPSEGRPWLCSCGISEVWIPCTGVPKPPCEHIHRAYVYRVARYGRVNEMQQQAKALAEANKKAKVEMKAIPLTTAKRKIKLEGE
jgi:hypothetical protein